MSSIAFHTSNDTLELRGSERAYMGQLIGKLSLAVLEECCPSPFLFARDKPHPLVALVPQSEYLHQLDGGAEEFWRAFQTWWMVSCGKRLTLHGRDLDVFSIHLNTAMVLGGDELRLLARLHGQCEIHAHVEGEHLPWVAEIIERGLASGLYRRSMGWEELVPFLRRADGPVVTSYSVCDSFPEGKDTFEEGLTKLRARHHDLEINPTALAAYRFTHKLSAFDVAKALSGRV
jgi:hypothetical protein